MHASLTPTVTNDWALLAIIAFLFVAPALLTLAGLCMVAYARSLLQHCQDVEDRVNTLLKAFCDGVNCNDPWEVLKKDLDKLGIKLKREPLPKPTHKPKAGLQ